jgi:hypothetical protein
LIPAHQFHSAAIPQDYHANSDFPAAATVFINGDPQWLGRLAYRLVFPHVRLT